MPNDLQAGDYFKAAAISGSYDGPTVIAKMRQLPIRDPIVRHPTAELDFRRGEALRGSGLIGESPAMAELAATVARVAGSGATRILIVGESGTGKALVARAIHAASPRAAGPFLEVNCASLPEQLIEAELFGAEKGAYTGAHQRRVGLVSLADKGSLFLDEIGEQPLPLQAKLLHFLENGQYRAIGSGRSQTADVRVIAATNRDLAAAVRAGSFREDLYFRLNVIQISLPPLRSRGGDIAALAEHFAAAFARKERCAPVAFSADARARLLTYPWPGNVRELKNLVERLTILHPGSTVTAANLPPEFGPAAPVSTPAASIGGALESTEREIVLAALTAAAGYKGKAAEALGISRHAFKRRLQRLGIE